MNESISQLPEFSRLLAIALLNLADDAGYFHFNVALIRGQLFPYEESDGRAKVERGLQDLVEVGYIQSRNGVGRVVKFAEHQVINHAAKKSPLRDKFCAQGELPEDSRNAPGVLPEGSGSPTGTLLPGKEGKGKGKEREVEGKAPQETSGSAPGVGARDLWCHELPKSFVAEPEFADAWDDWCRYCFETTGRRIAPTAAEQQLRELRSRVRAGSWESAIDAIRRSIAGQSKGKIYYEDFAAKGVGKGPPAPASMNDAVREILAITGGGA